MWLCMFRPPLKPILVFCSFQSVRGSSKLVTQGLKSMLLRLQASRGDRMEVCQVQEPAFKAYDGGCHTQACYKQARVCVVHVSS